MINPHSPIVFKQKLSLDVDITQQELEMNDQNKIKNQNTDKNLIIAESQL